MDMTNADPRQLFRVTAGPYRLLVGRKVEGADVRGRADMVYLESIHNGMVYEVSPKHVEALSPRDNEIVSNVAEGLKK